MSSPSTAPSSIENPTVTSTPNIPPASNTATDIAVTTPSCSDVQPVEETQSDGDVSDDDENTQPPSDLMVSIARELARTDIASLALFKKLVESSGPRKLSSTEALYWCDPKTPSEPCQFRFFGLLDLKGVNTRHRSYFNLGENTKFLEPKSFSKLKAQFEIRMIPNDVKTFQHEATEQSAVFLSGIFMLTEKFEEKRNNGVAIDEHPTVTKAIKVYEEEDRFTLVVQTEPIFTQPKEDHKNKSAKTVKAPRSFSMKDFEGQGSGLLSSPSKLLAREKQEAPPAKDTAEGEGGANEEKDTVSSPPKWIDVMPDPHGLYSKFVVKNPNFANYEVTPPKVLDENQEIIHPMDYNKRLVHLAPVSVVAELRLWEIRPTGRGGAGVQGSRGANGSRVYQLMLKSMQLLPYVEKEEEKKEKTAPGKGKGKRVAAEIENETNDAQVVPTETPKVIPTDNATQSTDTPLTQSTDTPLTPTPTPKKAKTSAPNPATASGSPKGAKKPAKRATAGGKQKAAKKNNDNMEVAKDNAAAAAEKMELGLDDAAAEENMELAINNAAAAENMELAINNAAAVADDTEIAKEGMADDDVTMEG